MCIRHRTSGNLLWEIEKTVKAMISFLESHKNVILWWRYSCFFLLVFLYWNCDFYGSVTPETKSRLLELANQHTKERISFKGFYKNVWDHIKEADVLLLTSKYEGLGMVLIEAAARGISLISSDCPVGPKEVINNNGYLYMPGDVEQLLLLLNQIVSFKIIIPSLMQVEESVQKFGYKKYASRIYSSFNLN